MRNHRLAINYEVSTYDETGHIEPESKLSHKLALEEILRSIYAISNLVKIVNDSRLHEIPEDADVLDSLGRLCCCITDDAFTHLDKLTKEQ
jgi:hypothetical protein